MRHGRTHFFTTLEIILILLCKPLGEFLCCYASAFEKKGLGGMKGKIVMVEEIGLYVSANIRRHRLLNISVTAQMSSTIFVYLHLVLGVDVFMGAVKSHVNRATLNEKTQ